jgi:hypothetical protein
MLSRRPGGRWAAASRLLAVALVIVGTPALAVEMSTEKNFVPAPNTPSYFTGDGSSSSSRGPAPAAPAPAITSAPAASSSNSRPTPAVGHVTKSLSGNKRLVSSAHGKSAKLGHATTAHRSFAAAKAKAGGRIAATHHQVKHATASPSSRTHLAHNTQ